MKILYLNHICWEWIFQRPQIIALELEKDFECMVINKKFILGKKIATCNKMPKQFKIVWQFPKADKIPFISNLNRFIYKRAVGKVVKNYDIIWICHPSLIFSLPSSFKGKIIYDCMDNHVAITSENNKKNLKEQEQELINRADLIFVSSENLKQIIPGLSSAHIIRNGYMSSALSLPIKENLKKNVYKAGYFGTVSSWFDYKILDNSTKKNSNIEYHIIGPISDELNDVIEQLHNDRICMEGTIEHNHLREVIEDYDILIMPFIVNEIILSVDPVKLYEYINYGKCIISVWYPEIDRFSPFVYFYKNQEEFDKLLIQLQAIGFPAKYSEKERREFLRENTWDSRYTQIKETIMEVVGHE